MQTNYQKITLFFPTNYSIKCTSPIEIYVEQDNQRTCFHVIEKLAICHRVFAYISSINQKSNGKFLFTKILKILGPLKFLKYCTAENFACLLSNHKFKTSWMASFLCKLWAWDIYWYPLRISCPCDPCQMHGLSTT